MSKNKQVTFSFGFAGPLTLLFIALKLTNYIDWSWWYVLMPLWIIPVGVIAICAIVGLIALAGLGIVAIYEMCRK
jgi:hypothetical protein